MTPSTSHLTGVASLTSCANYAGYELSLRDGEWLFQFPLSQGESQKAVAHFVPISKTEACTRTLSNPRIS